MADPFQSSNGIHFNRPQFFYPYTPVATSLSIINSGGSPDASNTAAFFTDMALRGLQDQTNWTAGIFKTILSVTSGAGLVGAYIGCTAGGAETHTVRFTVDGVVSTMTSSGLVSGARYALMTLACDNAQWTTASQWVLPGAEALAADKATFSAFEASPTYVPPWRSTPGIPMLIFNRSLLIEAKHSVNITNSTATAYSAVMYRNFLAA